MTLTATALSNGTVKLEGNVTSFAGILRTDENGIHPVRVPAALWGTAGDFTVYDHEAASTGWIQYVRPGGFDLTGTTLAGRATLPRFLIPATPLRTVTVNTVHDYSAARKSRTIFHEIIGRRSPIPSIGYLAPRTGTLGVLFDSFADARDLETLLGSGDAVMFRQSENAGEDMYFHAAGMSLATDEGKWSLSIEYVEIDFPPGDIRDIAGWTFDALGAGYGSFAEVALEFGSFAELATNLPVVDQ